MAKRKQRHDGTKIGLLLNDSMSDGKLSLEELTRIRRRVESFHSVIEDIRSEKISSWRHRAYKEGPPKRRGIMSTNVFCTYFMHPDNTAALKYQCSQLHLTGSEYVAVSSKVLDLCCSGSMKQFGYCIDVLVPEVVLRMYMADQGVDYDTADKAMLNPTVGSQKSLACVISSSSSSEEGDDQVDKGAPSSLIARGRQLQRRMKDKSTAGSLRRIPVSMCKMKIGRLGAYVRDGMSIEILSDESCSRDELLERGREAFQLEKTVRGQVLTLFTMTGSAILDEKWSLPGYAKRMKKSEVKLGIGYINPPQPEDDFEQSPSTSGYRTGREYGATSPRIRSSSPYHPHSSPVRSLSLRPLSTAPSTSRPDSPFSIESSPESLPPCDINKSRKKGKTKLQGRKRVLDTDSSSSDSVGTKRKQKKFDKAGVKEIVNDLHRACRKPAPSIESGNCMEYDAAELSSATQNYCRRNLLGRGGFGSVYRGMVRGCLEVAIKVLNQEGQHALIKSIPTSQMQSEVLALTRFRHPNILQLCGFCPKPPSLVYEYMPQGSLYDWLHNRKDADRHLDWNNRVNILKGTCRGIVYLHSAKPPMIHQDIKSANILLDNGMTAKLADFGFSTELPQLSHGKTMFSAPFIARSEGYYPSEVTSGHFSDRSDVYCYGVVVIETFTAQQVFDHSRSDKKLVDHLQEDLLDLEKFRNLQDPYLEQEEDRKKSSVFYNIQKECLRSHSRRPTSSEVMAMWESEI